MSIEAAAERLSKGPHELAAWERGDAQPTFRQAQTLASVLGVPFGFLFLAAPPAEARLPDFRRPPEDREARRFDANTLNLIQDVLFEHDWYKQILIEERYLLDANVFIEASNRYYALDICPGFWDWMDIVTEADAASVVPVREEIIGGSDMLAAWTKNRSSEPWFLPVDDTATQPAFSAVAAYFTSGEYTPQAQAKFPSGADPWLVAKAMIIGGTIVTHEVAAPGARKRVPLPNVCGHFKVATANTFAAMRSTNATLTLAA